MITSWLAPTIFAIGLTALEAAPLPLSLGEARARALTESPLVKRTLAEGDVMAARRVGASLLLPSNPVVSLALGPRRETTSTPTARGTQYALRAEQTLEVGGQRGARLAAIDRALDVEHARQQVARAETRARADIAYVTCLLAMARVDSASSREGLAGKLLESTRARMEAGDAAEIDLRLAEIERGNVAREKLDAELAVGNALSALRVVAGLPVGQPLRLTTKLTAPDTPLPPLETALLSARQRRAELRVLETMHEKLDADLVRWGREAIPNPALFLDVQRDLPGQTYFGAGISLPLPLVRRNQGERAIARAERDLVDREWSISGRTVEAEVEHAHRMVMNRRQQARILAVDVLPAAQANTRLVLAGWQAGKFDIFRVIQASREEWEARRSHLEALGSSWQAHIEWQRATGTQSP